MLFYASGAPPDDALVHNLLHIGTHTLPFPLSLELWVSRSCEAPDASHTSLARRPVPSHRHNQALNVFLPLVFLLCSILRPVLVRMRLRNPCLRMRISRDGRFMFIYRRGPQRICEPTPASAGFDVIAVLGTTSAIAAAAPTVSAVAPVAAAGVKAPGIRRPAAGLRAKMLAGADMHGRRIGREEKDLVL